MKQQHAFVLVCSLLLSFPLSAPAAAPGDAVNALLLDHLAKQPKSVTGVSVVNLRDGTVLAARNETKHFAPASNMKVLTSAFALASLGSDGKFTTSAYLDGADLIVTGQFDPTLGDPILAQEAGTSVYAELDRWAKALHEATAGKGVGRILLWARAPGRGYRHEDWPPNQYNKEYVAPLAQLNFMNNCFDVTFQVAGGKSTPAIVPAGRFFQVVNQIKVGAAQNWNLRLTDNDATLTLTGTVAKTSTDPLSVPVNDPALFFGRVLADRIVQAGMPTPATLSVVAPGKLPDGAKPLASTVTALSAVMARANKRSLNMAAECMLLRAGDGTWAGSAHAMEASLVKTFGLPADSLIIRDGSGLSKLNRVTPAAMTGVLAGLARGKDAKVFLETLPRGGLDGTLKRRFRDKGAAGRVLAKTGYITNVHCLSGYVLDKKNQPQVAFSMLTNGTNQGAATLEDNIVHALIKWVDGN